MHIMLLNKSNLQNFNLASCSLTLQNSTQVWLSLPVPLTEGESLDLHEVEEMKHFFSVLSQGAKRKLG